jgi:hypothetical protein
VIGKIISFIRFVDDITFLARFWKVTIRDVKISFNYKLAKKWSSGEPKIKLKINQDGRCIMEIKYRIAQAKSAFMNEKKGLCSYSTSISKRKCFIQL